MSEVTDFLIAPFGEILKRATSIALGTTLTTGMPWPLFLVPILRDNERRKTDEDILTNAAEPVQAIYSLSMSEGQQQASRLWAQFVVVKVDELRTQIKRAIKATIPDLVAALDELVDELV